jgi:hypothetical protein
MSQIVRQKTPEEQELDRKLAEFAALQSALIEKETELAIFAAELHAFELRYLDAVGPRLAWLDELIAERVSFEARRNPQNQEKQKEARQAREQADQTYRSTQSAQKETESAKKATVSDVLKKLFRELVRKFHPDLTTDEEEKRRRTELMKEINAAFSAGDEDRLREILGGASLDDDLGGGIGAELIRVIRKIAAIRERILAVQSYLSDLKGSEMTELRRHVEEMEAAGSNPFEDMIAGLDAQILEAVEAWYDAKRGNWK